MSEENHERQLDEEKMKALKELEGALCSLSSKPSLPLRDRAMVLQVIERIKDEQYEPVTK
jgi:hypothetical protein